MDGYKHYIRLDESDLIVKRLSTAFEQPIETDICVNENASRHYNDTVTNERGQYIAKWIDGVEVERSDQELVDEWNQNLLDNPPPKTIYEEIGDLKTQNAEIILSLVMNDIM
jgi:hypothetical protein